MKVMTKISLAIVPAMMLVLGGCSSGDVKETPASGSATADSRSIVPPPPAEMAPAGTESAQPDPMAERNKMDDPGSLLSQRMVYFDFDSSVIKDEAIPVVRAHAEHLSANNSKVFTLEGHCDERGTREYNIALGERRADAVRRMLVANGVAERQIKIVSYGEERPAQLGHNETAWAANRRAVFAY